MNIFCEGMNVDIKRSDGRVHGACISQVNSVKQCVHVEWYEAGETKGKELPIRTLLATNPMLAQMYQKSLNSMTTSTSSQQDSTISNKVAPTSNNDQSKVKQPTKTSVRNSMFVTPTTEFPKKILTPSSGAIKFFDEDALKEDLDKTDFISPSGKNKPNSIKFPGKSQTVLEIERLAKEREERRAKQIEDRKQKEQMKKVDPNNPNWEYYNQIREIQSGLSFKPLIPSLNISEKRIAVCVRVRPLSEKETKRNEIEVLSIPHSKLLMVHQPQTKVDTTKYIQNYNFDFDCVFDEHASNDSIYKATTQPLIQTFFDQGFVTCFAYGQTGSGKTFTMSGSKGGTENNTKGIYAQTSKEIFDKLNSSQFRNSGFYIDCAFFEIYGNKAYDLLNNRSELKVLADNNDEVQIVGLKTQQCSTDSEVLQVIKKGVLKRISGQTSANATSSRSHAIFQFILKNSEGKLWGKLSLVDLAGNERGADTGNSDIQTRRESAAINKSLLALKECIRHMSDPTKEHVPFRNSALTQFLKDSFIGKNSKLCMIAMVSPAIGSCEATLNTLRYAHAVKQLLGDKEPTNIDDIDMKYGDSEEDFDESPKGNESILQNTFLPDVKDCKESMIQVAEKSLKKLNLLSNNLEKFINKGNSISPNNIQSYVDDLTKFISILKPQMNNLVTDLESECNQLNESLQSCVENRKPKGVKMYRN
ncbi:Kinesin-like protein KIF2A [Strongyloides ratti]|uniref:Kinesin-like protein n=1 Tax=Strongyloides ratti TaxID=34506 RepID=A0A090L5Y7_STRRB|nr:Kinesin-like protein KIF2A [Strongyloides ratti]CEF62924.1 Kinesin-like protein KIF2A [Strongyloides ratti]